MQTLVNLKSLGSDIGNLRVHGYASAGKFEGSRV